MPDDLRLVEHQDAGGGCNRIGLATGLHRHRPQRCRRRDLRRQEEHEADPPAGDIFALVKHRMGAQGDGRVRKDGGGMAGPPARRPGIRYPAADKPAAGAGVIAVEVDMSFERVAISDDVHSPTNGDLKAES
jgi:hypothetical protein